MDIWDVLKKIWNSFKNEINNNQDRILSTFQKELEHASDSVVLKKLDETSGEAKRIVFQEAKRRNLI